MLLWGVLALALVAAVAVIAVAVRDRSSRLAVEVDAAWDALTATRTDRHALIPGLVALLRPHARDQQRLVDYLAAHHIAASRAHDPVAVGRAERRLEESLATVLTLADARPALAADPHYVETRRTVLRLGRRIAAGQDEYDAAATAYNATAAGVLGSLLRLRDRPYVGLRAGSGDQLVSG